MSFLRNEKGMGTIKVWAWLLFLALVIYVGSKILPLYIDFERMKDEMSIKASLAQVLKDDEIRMALVTKAKELDLPLGTEDFIILRDDENHLMTIKTMWDVEVHFPFDIYVRNFHFEPVAIESTNRIRM